MSMTNTTVAMGSATAYAEKCSSLPPEDYLHANVPAVVDLVLYAGCKAVGPWNEPVVCTLVSGNGVDVGSLLSGTSGKNECNKDVSHKGLQWP